MMDVTGEEEASGLLDADEGLEHLRLASGECVISVNGQGHLPCGLHPAVPPLDTEALQAAIIEHGELRGGT